MRAIAKMIHKRDQIKTRTIVIGIEKLDFELAQDALMAKELYIFDDWNIDELKEIKKFMPIKNKVG